MISHADQHVGDNKHLVAGLQSVLGEKFPIIGGSSSATMGVYEKGKFVPKSNLGILLSGDFACGFAIDPDPFALQPFPDMRALAALEQPALDAKHHAGVIPDTSSWSFGRPACRHVK